MYSGASKCEENDRDQPRIQNQPLIMVYISHASWALNSYAFEEEQVNVTLSIRQSFSF